MSVSPSGDAPTAITYSSPVKTTVSRTGADGNSTWRRNVYDPLGRLVREIRQMPAAFAVRVREYDAAGNTSFESEWGACGSADGDCLTVRPAGTTFSDFDPFGRVRLIRRADGSRSTVSYADGGSTYSETLKTINVENVGGSCSGGSCSGGLTSTTVFRSDAFGRLTRVTEPASPAADVTDYIYDVAGKVVKVTQGGQSRKFLYDSFGFPLSEDTPEAGFVDYLTTFQGVPYSDVGSIGNVRSRREGNGTITQSLAYDPAGRLKTQSGDGVNFVTNCYDGDLTLPCTASGGTAKLGKLTQRIGANPGKPSTVTESFTYSGLAGRLSQKDVSVTGTPLGTLTAAQSWTYNSLGLIATHTHPRIGTDSAITASYTYSNGLPTALSAAGQSLVTAATYSAAGALASWTGGSSLTTTITQDLTLLPRPLRITTSHGAALATGDYSYDGAGNIRGIGSDTYSYDARSRLTVANITGQPQQTFAYDPWGNLNPVNQVDQATNRLMPAIASYDPRGNITSTGGQSYSYDSLSRQTGAGTERYLYDGAGERLARVAGGASFYTVTPCRVLDTRDPPGTPVDPSAPRFVQMTGACDIAVGAAAVAGNLTVVAPSDLGYLTLSSADTSPAVSTLNYKTGVTRANNFVVGLSGTGRLRLASSSSVHAIIDVSGYFMPTTSGETWTLTLRDEANRLSTEYSMTSTGRTRTKDYFYLGNLLVATRDTAGTRLYYSSDHLGTPRLVTNQQRQVQETHKYKPFGEEIAGGFGAQPLKFAAMERDLTSLNDYVHARYQSSVLGRFLSPDLLGGRPEDPQTWNRYAYARNNPLKYVDPDGKAFDTFVDVVFIAYDLFDIGRTVIGGDTVTETQFKALGGDVVGALIPGLTGIGAGIRRLGNLDDATKLVQKTKSLDAVADAYEIAQQGGRHAGTLRNYQGRSLKEITNAVRGYEKNVAEHIDKLANPSRYAKDWAALTPRQQQGLLRKWEKDLRRNKELAVLMRSLVGDR